MSEVGRWNQSAADFERTILGEQLVAALENGNDSETRVIVNKLIALLGQNRMTDGAIRGAIMTAHNHKHWPSVIALAEAANSHYLTLDLPSRRRYAQALIELGALSAAECMLERLLSEGADDQTDEALGLRGRIAKQRYVEFNNPDHLRRALAAYHQAYELPGSDKAWSGGNLLALMNRLHEDDVAPVAGLPRLSRLQHDVEAEINAIDESLRNVWLRSTEIELLLSIGQRDRAVPIARSLANTSNATAFELESLRRQLTELWELGPEDPIIQALGDSTLGLGSLAETTVPNASSFEKLLHDKAAVPYGVYVRGIGVARFVCMITDRHGYAVGTGFLLPGNELHDEWGDDLVLLTNAHVVSEQGYPGSVSPEFARARFTALADNPEEVPLIGGLALLWSSPPDKLDASVLQIVPPGELTFAGASPVTDPISLADETPSVEETDPYVYVVGHPDGRPLSLSIRGNELLDANEAKLHYRAPTEPGSSGSPVFDASWELVGLHNAGDLAMPRLDNDAKRYPANQAINILAIRAAIAEMAK